MRRRTFLAAAGTAAVGLPRAGLTQPVTVRVGVAPTDASSEAYYAIEQGFFTDAGVTANVATYVNGGTIASAVASGTLDVGIANPVAVATGVTHGVPFVVVAAGAVYDTSAPTTLLCVAKDSPIARAADFEGKAIACPALREIGELVTVAFLEKNGADPSKVAIVEMPIPAMGAALQRGTIAGALISEPAFNVATAAGEIRPFAKVYDVIAPRFYNSVWLATRTWYAANADAAKRFTTAIYAAARWANAADHRTASGAILARYAKIDPETLRRMTRARFGTAVQPALLDPLLAMAARGNLTSRRVSVAELTPSAPEQLLVDLDGDGRPDVITLDQTPSAITVHVRFANPAHQPQVFRFGVDSGREDAVCRVPVHLEIVPHHGVAVVDGACDSIHFRWNPKTKQLEWWRL